MSRGIATVCLVIGVLWSTTTNPLSAQKTAPKKPAKKTAEILNLKNDDKVEVEHELEGAIDVKGRKGDAGWPVVLIQAQIAGAREWWVQRPVRNVDPKTGEFRVLCSFGEKDTPSGTKFRVVIILAKDEKTATREFPRGKQLDDLPPGSRRSDFVTVIRK